MIVGDSGITNPPMGNCNLIIRKAIDADIKKVVGNRHTVEKDHGRCKHRNGNLCSIKIILIEIKREHWKVLLHVLVDLDLLSFHVARCFRHRPRIQIGFRGIVIVLCSKEGIRAEVEPSFGISDSSCCSGNCKAGLLPMGGGGNVEMKRTDMSTVPR